MVTPHRPRFTGRLKATQTPTPAAGGAGPIWASLLAHGVLVVGGLGYTVATSMGPGTAVTQANITLESAAMPALLAPVPEAEPTAPAPLAPQDAPLPPDAVDTPDVGTEPLPPDPIQAERHEPDKDWRPFDGHVVARLRPPARAPAALETPAAAPSARPASPPAAHPELVLAPQPLDHVNRKPLPRFGKGEVVVRLNVAADGTVDDVSVVTQSGPRALATSVVGAVRDWQFKPATRNGCAIAHPFTARFVF
ncbi:MAG: hypothetical protein CMJ90_13235 [Planctomycetes bacterium]|nr:hypothetical protein [Planctomycetota bacterium]